MKNTEKRLIEKNDIASAIYAERVNALLRGRYTLSEELSLLRRRADAVDDLAKQPVRPCRDDPHAGSPFIPASECFT